eukprot:scaffold53369_cov16-Tisochrysis_lutea.AAC.1
MALIAVPPPSSPSSLSRMVRLCAALFGTLGVLALLPAPSASHSLLLSPHTAPIPPQAMASQSLPPSQKSLPPSEKTSLLQWAAAGGETAFRFTWLSAKTGAQLFFDPSFSFEKAGKNYYEAGEVTSQQMGELGGAWLGVSAPPPSPGAAERPYFIHALKGE